jgi:hypothetical protein
VALVVLCSCVYTIIRTRGGRNKSPYNQSGDFDFSSTTWIFFQTFLILLLLTLAIWRSASPTPNAAELIGYLFFALVIFVLPAVSQITIGTSSSVTLVKSVVNAEASKALENNQTAMAALATSAQVVAEAQRDLTLKLTKASNQQDRLDFTMRTFGAVTDALSAQLIASPDPAKTPGTQPVVEPRRVSVWAKIADDPAAGTTILRLVFASPPQEFQALQATPQLTQGLSSPIGYALSQGLLTNFSTLGSGERPASSSTYSGILIAPLRADGSQLGVVILERANVERFDPVAAPIARALGALYVLPLVL